MTRKDYELIAAGLREAHAHCERIAIDEDKKFARRSGLRCAASFIADQLETTNPRFDRARFIDACAA